MEIPVQQKVRVMISSLDSSCMSLLNVMDQLCESDEYEGYSKGVRFLEGLYGTEAKDFAAAIAKLNTLPVANDEAKATDLLSAVQSVLYMAQREGHPEPTYGAQSMLFTAIE